jgi:hypothetical protein
MNILALPMIFMSHPPALGVHQQAIRDLEAFKRR